jgi:DNA-binding NtrC family response regulator
MNKTIKGFDAEAEARLADYDWPGNVRQLRNVIERAVILCEGDRLAASDLGLPEPAAALPGAASRVPRSKDDR